MSFAMIPVVMSDGESIRSTGINPAHVLGVGAMIGRDDRCEVMMANGLFEVVGSVAEVVAALEAAGAPAVAPVVEVAPTDLEMAAKVVALMAEDRGTMWKDIADIWGCAQPVVRHNLRMLAARLRGAR